MKYHKLQTKVYFICTFVAFNEYSQLTLSKMEGTASTPLEDKNTKNKYFY